MTSGQDKLIDELQDALATELTLAQTLRAQIGLAPRGTYRRALEHHLRETHDHAEWVGSRLEELGVDRNPAHVIQGVAKAVSMPVIGLAKTPFDLVRGSSPEEKLLKNARDGCAAEAFEAASYQGIERMANEVGDAETARLAAAICQQEEQALASLQQELPKLAQNVIEAEVRGRQRFDLSTTGAADAFRRLSESARQVIQRTAAQTERAAQQAERQARASAKTARAVTEGGARGIVAQESDLPIANYDALSANDVVERMSGLSQQQLATIAAYERKNRNRRTVLKQIDLMHQPGESQGRRSSQSSASSAQARNRQRQRQSA